MAHVRGRGSVTGGGVIRPVVQGGGGRHRAGGVGDQVRGGEPLPRLSVRLLQDALPSLHVDPAVERDEQQRGDVERAEGGVDGVENVVGVHVAARHLLRLHLAPEERRQRDGDGDHPGGGDHARCARRRALLGVLHRVRDGPVAVQRNYAQVEDGGGAARYVRGQPDVAHHLPERPRLADRVERADGHHQDGHEEVRDGQGGDQEVGRGVELSGLVDGGDDERVGERRGESYEG